MTLVQRFPNAPQNYDAQNEAQFRNMVRQALSDASSPVVLTESVGQSFEAATGGTPAAGDALVYAAGAFTATKTFTGAMTFTAALTATAGGSLTGTWSDMGSVTTIDINGGTIDGVPIGGAVPAAGAFTTLNATGGGSLTGTWSDLGTVTTVDINGGTIDGVPIGGAVPAAGAFTTLNATGGGALTGTWTDMGSVTTIDINGGTIDGTAIGGASPAAASFTTLKLGVTAVSTNTTLDATHCIVLVTAAAARTITLPAASGLSGRLYYIKNIPASSFAVTVDGNGAETIDDFTTITLNPGDSAMIVCDGTEWFIL